MSIRLMTIVWDIPWLTQSQLLIALKLADYANDEGGSIFPARATLAAQSRASESTVKRTLKGFRESGLLKVVREGGNGPGDTTEYALDVATLMLLHDGYMKLVDGDNGLSIEPGDGVDNLEEKGATVNPLVSTRGSPKAEGVHPLTPLRGSPIDPQPTTITTIKDSPSREGARSAVGNSDLKGSGVSVRHRITDRDCQWDHWLVFLRSKGRDDLADKATASGAMSVHGSKWPKDDSPLPWIDPAGLSETSKRITGDAA